MSQRALDQPSRDRTNAHARTHRLVIRVHGVVHEVVKIDGLYANVTFACEPNLATLVDPSTEVFEYGTDEAVVDCMTCLVARAWV